MDFLNKHSLKIIAVIVVLVILSKCNSSNNSTIDRDPITKLKVSVDTNNKDVYIFERPESGFSPYDSYYGKGIYNNTTDNTIEVTAPLKKDIVIMFKDIYSGRW